MDTKKVNNKASIITTRSWLPLSLADRHLVACALDDRLTNTGWQAFERLYEIAVYGKYTCSLFPNKNQYDKCVNGNFWEN